MRSDSAFRFTVRRILLLGWIAAAGTLSPAAEEFSFAVIADPHIDGTPQHTACLQSAVDWIIRTRDTTGIALVFVTGDIGWFESAGQSHLDTARMVLDVLTENGIVYVPIIGDNEISRGAEADFGRVFESHLKSLARRLNRFDLNITPVDGHVYYNYSFDYNGCHFVCADFAGRDGGDLGDLHDVEGGSWPWFTRDIRTAAATGKKENIVILTHIGLFNTGVTFADQYLYSPQQMQKVRDFTAPYADRIAANYAGHIHQNFHYRVTDAAQNPIYDVWTTDEPWQDVRFPEMVDRPGSLRWVRVSQTDRAFSYTQHQHSD